MEHRKNAVVGHAGVLSKSISKMQSPFLQMIPDRNKGTFCMHAWCAGSEKSWRSTYPMAGAKAETACCVRSAGG